MAFRKRFIRGFITASIVALADLASAAPGSATYTYDSLGRLRSVIYEDGSAQTYSYDAAGNRSSSASLTPGVFSISPSAAVSEGQAATLTVTRTSGNSNAATLSYATSNGTAIAGNNYDSKSGSLMFASGQNSQSFPVQTRDNNVYDGTRSFYVTLTGVSNAVVTGGTSTVNVNETDVAPRFSIAAGPAVNEGLLTTFTVSRANPTSLTQSVTYATADGTARAGFDYTAATNPLVFAPNDPPKVVQVQTTRVALYEGSRSFFINLSNPTAGAVIGTGGASATINDIDPATTFAINSPPEVSEGTSITFTVTKGGGAAGIPFAVNYSTASGTAISGTDFSSASGALTFNPSDVSKTAPVSTIDNRTDTILRTFTMAINSGSSAAPIVMPTGTGSIRGTSSFSSPVLSPGGQIVQDGHWIVNWTSNSPGATYFEVSRTDTGAVLVNTTAYIGSGTFLRVPDNGKEITLVVRACNGSICGAPSNPVTVVVCYDDFCFN